MYRRTLPTLTIGLLAVGIQAANAQQDDIYELITTAIHTRSSETALPVTVMTGNELHEAVRATLGDTLAGQPGINNASFGPAVGQTVIRGQQGRRVMNLSNGISNGDASGNSADHAQTVEAILANSIEVLRGPSTLLYGGGAIGGVVNVVDRRIASAIPDAPSFAIETRHDTATDLDTVVGSLDFATASLAWHFDALRRDWNDLDIPGYAIDSRYLEDPAGDEPHTGEDHTEDQDNTFGSIANTGGESSAATAGVSWIFDAGYLGFAVSDMDNLYGLPGGAHGHAAEGEDSADFVNIDMQRTRYDVTGQWHDLASWVETVDYRLSFTDYAHAEVESTGEIGTRFTNESWQHRLQITHTDTDDRHGVMGLQYSNEEFAALGEERFIPVTDISATGLFLVEDFHAMAATIEVGGRYNRDEYNPLDTITPAAAYNTWSMSGSALWDLDEGTTLGVSVSRSQRAPSAEELYSNYGLGNLDDCVIHVATASCEIGDTGFSEETSLNTDLTLYLDYGMFSATITAFYNRFDNYIAQISTGQTVAAFPVHQYQQDDARFSGLEVDTRFQLTDLASLRLFGDAISGSFDSYGDAPRMPPNRIGAEFRLDSTAWSAYATIIHAAAQEKPGNNELGTGSWTRFDIGADYTFDTPAAGELMLFITGRNLGNSEIRLATSYLRGYAPEAGRSLETGIRYRF